MTSPTSPARISPRDHLLGALLGALYLAVLLGTSSQLGMSRDEGFYVTAAERYGTWYEKLLEDPQAALTPSVIDRYWSYNNEHPALAKTMFAWTWLIDQRGAPWVFEQLGSSRDRLFPKPSMAYRFFGMLSGALTLWLIYVFGARAADRRVGIFAAIAYATLPRVFYHAHLNCFDVPIVLMIMWTVYAYWRALVHKRWAVMAGIAFGCALATKHNAWIVPGILLLHWLWVSGHELGRRKRGDRIRVLLTPYWLIAMLTIGPVIFVGSWPWLWHDTWPRIAAYAGFHLNHAYYNMAYLGVNYFRPPFPVSFPFVMTLFTVPLTISVLTLLGIAVRARAMMPRFFALRMWPRGTLKPDARATDVLWIGCAMAPLLTIALPSTPIFGGTKHWFTAYPFLMMFAGHAALFAIVSAESRFLGRGLPEASGPAGVLAMSLLLAPSLAETAHSHPLALSHYTLPAGGVPGAADLGMNRQFWGFTTGSVVGFLRERMPKGGRVFLNDTTATAFEMLKRDGLLPQNIRPTANLSDADYVLVHHEDHMAEVDFQAWQAFGTVAPAHVLTYDGVPIVSIYEHPRRQATR